MPYHGVLHTAGRSNFPGVADNDAFSATLTIADTFGQQQILVMGSGEGQLQFSPSKVNFGTVTENFSHKPRKLRVINPTNVTVNILGVSIVESAANPSQPLPPFGLSSDGCSGTALAPGGHCDIFGTFKPTVDPDLGGPDNDLFQASLTINTDVTGEYVVPLRGSGEVGGH